MFNPHGNYKADTCRLCKRKIRNKLSILLQKQIWKKVAMEKFEDKT